MPYKTGKLKGELLVSEIRKLVRLHNKLSKIKIPPRSSRDDIIKIVESNGYKVDHKNQKLTATRMNKDLTLKEAQETFPVKKRVKKEPPKPAEKPKPKKEDEVRPAKKPFPPIPKNIRGKRINVKFGKPPTTERISTGVIAEGRLIEQPKKKVIKIKKKAETKEPTGKKVKKAVEKIEKKAIPKKKATPKKKPTANISLFLGIMNTTARQIQEGKVKTQKEIFEDLGTGMNTFAKMTKTYNEIKQTQKGEKLEKLNKSYMTIKNFIEKPTPKKAEPKKAEPKKAEPTPKKEGINKFLTMNLEQIKKEIEKVKERGESGFKITKKMDLPTEERNEKGDKPTLERVKKDYEKLTRWCAFNDEIFKGIDKRLLEFVKDGTITREEYRKLQRKNNVLDNYTGGICSILMRYQTGRIAPYSLPREFYIKMKEVGQEERDKLLTTAKKAEPKKAEPKKDLTPIINQRVTTAENNYSEDYNNLQDWFKKNEKKKFIYPLELTSFFPNKFNDENYEAVIGNVKGFIEIYAVIGQDIIDNNDLDLKIKRAWDKAPKKMKKKYVDNLGRDAKKEGMIDITTRLATTTKAEPKKAEPKKAEPKKKVQFEKIEEGLEDMDDEINLMTAEIRGSSKYSLKKANFTEKEVFDESKFKNMKDLESQFRTLREQASDVTDKDQKQVAENLIENIRDRIPFIKDNIK